MTLEILGAAKHRLRRGRRRSSHPPRERDRLQGRLCPAAAGRPEAWQKVERLAAARAAKKATWRNAAATATAPSGWSRTIARSARRRRTCQGLCRSELAIFQSLLPSATVERTDHILAGARRCAYRIEPRTRGGKTDR